MKKLPKYTEMKRSRFGFIMTREWLDKYVNNLDPQYPKTKWTIFCEMCLDKEYTVYLDPAWTTKSKYITIEHNDKRYKVRFSNHKPSYVKQMADDSDFYVGVTHTGVKTYLEAFAAAQAFLDS